MIHRLIEFLFRPIIDRQNKIIRDLEELRHLSIGRNFPQADSIRDSEFKVYSQWGDDGILQYLIRKLNIKNDFFVEFGVEDYKESNTKYLLLNNNWSGLVMDSSSENISSIRREPFYWKYDLKAKCAFVTAENINELLLAENIQKEIGLLHIDVDGNEYWIWKALSSVSPDIVSVEYNSVFGIERSITIPYKSDFNRSKAHYSNLYAGASLSALCDLAQEKGYVFVGSNSAGNDAYFVKKEKAILSGIASVSLREGYVESKFRESRDEKGNLSFMNGHERLSLLKGMPVLNTRNGQVEYL